MKDDQRGNIHVKPSTLKYKNTFTPKNRSGILLQ